MSGWTIHTLSGDLLHSTARDDGEDRNQGESEAGLRDDARGGHLVQVKQRNLSDKWLTEHTGNQGNE